jgi:hypothetical protein
VAGLCGAARIFARPSTSSLLPSTSSQRATTSPSVLPSPSLAITSLSIIQSPSLAITSLSIIQPSSFGSSTSSTRSTSPTPASTFTPIPTTISSEPCMCCDGYENFKQYKFLSQNYTQLCDVDFSGGDLYYPDWPIYTGNFYTCADACSRSEGCVGVTYNETATTCYLKKQINLLSPFSRPGYCAMVPYIQPAPRGRREVISMSNPALPALQITTTGRCGSDVGLTCQGSSFGQCCSGTGYW